MKRSLTLLILLMLACGTARALDDNYWLLGTDRGVYRPAGGTWTRVPLVTCADLAVQGQVPYVIGDDLQVWTPGPAGKNWAPILPGLKGTRIAADVDDSLYVVGVDKGVYRAHEGRVTRVGLGLAQDVAADHGTVYVIGTDGHVWSCADGKTWKMFNLLARGRRVAARGGRVLIVGTDDGVYEISSDRIKPLGLARCKDVDISAGGEAFAVGLDGFLLRFAQGDWQRFGSWQAQEIVFPR